MELLVEALDGHERVLYRGLHGNPELFLLFSQFQRYITQHLGNGFGDELLGILVGGGGEEAVEPKSLDFMLDRKRSRNELWFVFLCHDKCESPIKAWKLSPSAKA